MVTTWFGDNDTSDRAFQVHDRPIIVRRSKHEENVGPTKLLQARPKHTGNVTDTLSQNSTNWTVAVRSPGCQPSLRVSRLKR